MQYRVIRTDQADLEHGLFGRKGSQKKDHKYLLREWVNGKWKYYYTQAQINAKKLGSKVTGKNNSKEIKKLENAAASAKKSSEKAGKEFSKAAKNAVSDASKSLSKAISNGKKKVDKALKNFGNTSSKALKDAKKQIDKGKKSVENAIKNIAENGPPGYYSVQTLKNGNLSMWGGASDKAFAKAHSKAAVSDVATGFKNAAKEIGKGFKSAGKDLSLAGEYQQQANGSKANSMTNDPLYRFVDNLGLDNKGYNPANYDWETAYSGWHKSATEAEKAYRASKKKKK